MLTYKDTVKEEIKDFEQEIDKAKSVADEQAVAQKVNLYQQIYKMQSDLERLKGSLRMFIIENNTSSKAHMPEVEADRKIVKSDLKKLKKVLPEEEQSFASIFKDTCKEISDDIKNCYVNTKDLTLNKKKEAKESTKQTISNVEKKIDKLEEKVKDSWHSMSDSVKETTSKSLGSLKKKKEEMKEWFYKKL